MARSTSKVAIRVDVDSKDLDKLKADLKKSASNLQIMSKAAKENAKNMQKMQAELTKLNAKVAKGNKAVLGWLEGWKGLTARFLFVKHAATQVAHFARVVFNAAKRGAEFADMMAVMRRRVDGFDKVMSDARVATGGMMSDMAMAKSAALMSSFGIDMSRMGEIMSAVTKAAIATGQSADFMLSSFARGVARTSPLVLDNLGVQIALAAAYDEFAQQVGKASGELTKAEQITAVMNKTLSELARTSSDVDLDQTMSAPLQRMEAQMDNVTGEIGQFVASIALWGAELIGLAGPLGKIEETYERLSRAQLHFIRHSRTYSENVTKEFEAALKPLLSNFEKFEKKLAKISTEGGALRAMQNLAPESIKSDIDQWNAYNEVVSTFASEAARDAKRAALGLNGAIAGLHEEYLKTKTIGEFNALIASMPDVMDAGSESAEGVNQSLQELAKRGIEATTAALVGQTAATRESVVELSKANEEMLFYNEVMKAGGSANLMLAEANEAVKKSQKELSETMKRGNIPAGTQLGLQRSLSLALKDQSFWLNVTKSNWRSLIKELSKAGFDLPPFIIEMMGGMKGRRRGGGKAAGPDYLGLAKAKEQLRATKEEGSFLGPKEDLDLLKASNKFRAKELELQFKIDALEEKRSKRRRGLRKADKVSLETLKTQLQVTQEVLLADTERAVQKEATRLVDVALAADAAAGLKPSQFLTEAVGDRKSVFGDLVRDSADMYGMAFEAVEAQIDAIAETRAELFDEFGVSLDSLNPKLSQYEQSLIRQRDLMLDLKEVFGFMGSAIGEMGEQLDFFSGQLQSFSDMEPTAEFLKVREAVGILSQSMNAMAESANAAGMVTGAISGIGKMTASFVEGEREKAWVMAAMQQALAIAAFATLNIPGGIAHQVAAGMFMAIATGAIKTHRPAPPSGSATGAPKSGQAKSVENVVNVHISGLTTISEAELGFQINNALNTAKEHGYV
jgi:hypothetical protein